MSTKQRREPYAKLFASWWCHQRTGPLSLAAAGLEARMLSWSSHHGSDGRIPRASVPQIAGGGSSRRDVERALAELLKAGVLEEDGDTLVIRHYLDANISKQRDEERRHGQNERQTRHRAASVTRDSGVIGEPVTRDQSVTKPISLDHDHDQDQSLTSVSDSRARTTSSEPARKAIEAAYRSRKLSVPGRIAALTPSYEDSAKLAGLDMATLPGLLDAFFADPAMKAKGHPVGFFLENPNQWTPATAQAQTSTKPLPADLHDHERTLIVAAREGRWWRDREKWDRHFRTLLARHPGIAPPPPWWSEEAA